MDKHFVYVLGDDGIAKKREFTAGLSNWTQTEVISGLQAGDKVVLTPDHAGLKDGVPAKVEDAADKAKAAEKKAP